jgi:hypothetical protein
MTLMQIAAKLGGCQYESCQRQAANYCRMAEKVGGAFKSLQCDVCSEIDIMPHCLQVWAARV